MGNTQHPKRPLSTGYPKRPPYYQNQENVNDEYLIPSKHNNTNDVISNNSQTASMNNTKNNINTVQQGNRIRQHQRSKTPNTIESSNILAERQKKRMQKKAYNNHYLSSTDDSYLSVNKGKINDSIQLTHNKNYNNTHNSNNTLRMIVLNHQNQNLNDAMSNQGNYNEENISFINKDNYSERNLKQSNHQQELVLMKSRTSRLSSSTQDNNYTIEKPQLKSNTKSSNKFCTLSPNTLNNNNYNNYILSEPPLLSNLSSSLTYSGLTENTDLLGQILLNPFSIFVFSITTRTSKILDFNETTLSSSLITTNYSPLSSFCNSSHNILYISGGITPSTNEPHSLFWSINLSTSEISLHSTSLLCPKSSHGMIFIPEQYIFFIGGNTTSTFYYDITKNTFNNWAELNYKRIEPAMYIINNTYLYIFDNVRVSDKNEINFERTNLHKKPTWRIVTPVYPEGFDMKYFNQKFFSVCPLGRDETQVLFLGGNASNDVNKCFMFDLKSLCLSVSEVNFEPFDSSIKTFMRLSKNNDFVFPNVNRNNLYVILYNKQTHQIKKVRFNNSNNNNNNNVTTQKVMTTNLTTINLTTNPNISFIQEVKEKKYNFGMPKSSNNLSLQNNPITLGNIDDGVKTHKQ